ncbi:MAG: hypothetical protein K0B05_09550 [Bacteroidales bacterium]|nr:hypothetical protein [Bacteroidales bacterium]
MRAKKINNAELLFLGIFSVTSLLFFSLFYYHHLYQREQLQLFQITFSYFLKGLSLHGGFAIYLGEFFTQFFGRPVAGASIITAMMVILQQAVKRLLFAISGRPGFAFLSFLPPLGYWLLLTDQFYYLSGMIGLIISILASCFYLSVRKRGSGIISGILLIPVVFWLAGASYMVLTAVIILAEFLQKIKRLEKSSADPSSGVLLLYIAIALITPLIARKLFFADTLLQSYISGAYYSIRIFFPLPLICVFASVPLVIILHAFMPEEASLNKLSVAGSVTPLLIIGTFIPGLLYFSDFKEEKRIAYENLVYNKQWEKIIRKAEKEQPEDRMSMVAVNLALACTGRLSSEMFNFSQDEENLFLPYERRGMTPFVAGEPFLYLGLINFSQMFAAETIASTPDAKYPVRAFRRMAETYYLNGQYEIAGKYFMILSRTLFCRGWADQYLSMIDSDKEAFNDTLLKDIHSLISEYDFFYNDQQMDIAMRYLLISNPQNRVAFEYLMAYYLLNKDFDGFLHTIGYIKGLDYNKLPVVFQEAIAYILTITSETPEQLMGLTLDQSVTEKIMSYAELFSAGREDTLKFRKEFGSTYWYYLHFK